jgi:serine/threonine protein kinase/Tfp pilus assembly protein PilF
MQVTDRPRTSKANVSRVCGKCGSKVFADAPQGFCSLCLFETGLGPLLNEDDETVGSSAARMPMEFDDYELLKEIGRGGQGVVYRARQKSLNRTVALKVIGVGRWATEAHLRRFRLEAEAAASLNHPSIVPIHEIGERDGYCYFSMNLVEGGQLDEVVRREAISVRRAAELIAKLARTVHYAHEHGILHRDIKPGNVLLDAAGEPHLTDFGLARLVETESTVTRTTDVLGTPSYMAPEQATGNNAALTRATDVYGLGAVLYQLLTGRPPFAGGTTYETVRLVLENDPRQPRLLNPKVDRDLSTICLKCLEKNLQRRYASALGLAEDLERWLRREPIQARRTNLFIRGKKWLQRNPTTATVVALSLSLAAALGVIVSKTELLRRPATAGIAVLPFENLNSDPDSAYFAEGIHEEILTRLASIADLKVISRASTQHYQSKPANLSEVGKQLGVANILEGSVQKAGDKVRVNVQLINARNDSPLWAQTYDRTLTDILGVESEIAKGIAESLQAKISGREEQALAVKPTNNPEAYDAYLRGLAFRTRFFYSADSLWKAIRFFERAVQLDPNFALAWGALSRVHALLSFNLGRTTDREAARKALEHAQELQPNLPETQLALGYYQYWVLRDYRLGEITFRRLRKILPGSSEVAFALGLVTRRQGNWDDSTAYTEQALALDPRNLELLTDAAWGYAMLRQFTSALKLYDRALDLMPDDSDLMTAKAATYQAQGNLKEAANFLSQINAQTLSENAFVIKVTQLRLERNYDEAIRLLQTRLAQFRFRSELLKYSDQVRLALVQRVASDSAGAKATAEEARNVLEQLCKTQPDNEDAWALLALANAVIGDKDSSEQEIARAMMLVPSSKDRVGGPTYEEYLALIQMMLGENSDPISTLAGLLKTPYNGWLYDPMPVTPTLLRLDPIWDPLRADHTFQKLCAEKQP